MYVSTTSVNSSVGSAVSSPHFSRLFSNVDRFFRLHPSREYLSLSMPAHQKNDHGSKKRLILKECAKIGKVRKKGRERRFSFFFCFFFITVQYVYSHYLQLNNSCLLYLHYNSIFTRTLLLNTTTYYIHTTITIEYHCHYFNSIKIHHTIQN